MKKIKIEYLVFGLGLLLYLSTSSLHPFPGESSNLLLSHAWIHDFQLPSHPLWGFLAALVSYLPFSLAPKMNGLSAVFGAFSLLLAYRVLNSCTLDSDYDDRTPSARTMMSLAGPLYLICLLPIWFVSNRAHYASFELLLFLLAIRVLQKYRDQGGLLRLAGLGAIFGLGMIESSTFIVAAPVAGLYVIYLMWRNKHIAPAPIAIAAASWLLALAFFFIPVWLYTRTDVYAWGGASGFWHAAWLTYSSSARTLRSQIGQVGWIILLMTSLIPYVGAMWLKRSQPVENRPFSVLMVALIIFVLGAVLLFNIPISPWMLLPGTVGFPLPALMLAIAFAISVGFWTAFFKDRKRGRHSHRAASTKAGRKTEAVFTLILLALAIAGGAVNFKRVAPRINAGVAGAAEIIAAGLPPQAVVVGSGNIMDSAIKLAAHDRGIECSCINMQMASHPIYKNYLRDLFRSPRATRLLDLNLGAAIKEWLAADATASERAAFFVNPEWWEKAGRLPLWRDGLYYGADPGNPPDLDRLHAAQQDVGRRASAILSEKGEGQDSEDRILRSLSRIFARGFNDLGVYFERNQRNDLAADAYGNAIAIDGGNLSAALNLHSCPGAEESEREAMLARISEMLPETELTTYQALKRDYGYLARRESLALLRNLTRADKVEPESPSDNPDPDDAEEFKRAIDLMKQEKWGEAIGIFRGLVEKRPDYSKVWLVMGLAAFQQQDYETIDECVQAMLERQQFWPDLVMVAALSAREQGRLERARRLLIALLRFRNDSPKLLEELLKVDVELGGSRNTEAYLGRLLELDSDNFFGNFLLGTRLYEKGELDLALEAYKICLEQGESHALLNNMAWVLNELGQSERALELARRSLEIEDRLSSSWDTLARIQIKLEKYEEAQKSLERALELDPGAISPRLGMIELKIMSGDRKAAEELALDLESQEETMTPEQRSKLADMLDR